MSSDGGSLTQKHYRRNNKSEDLNGCKLTSTTSGAAGTFPTLWCEVMLDDRLLGKGFRSSDPTSSEFEAPPEHKISHYCCCLPPLPEL